MFDKKEMKMVKFDQIRKYLANGEDVFMVMDDGQLVEMNLNSFNGLCIEWYKTASEMRLFFFLTNLL